MNFRTIIILGAILPAIPLYARGKADVMIMKNGDRMTCEVMALEAGVLYVDFEYIDGTVSVNWSKVARLESKRLFHVKTEDGSVYTGTLSTPETAAGRPCGDSRRGNSATRGSDRSVPDCSNDCDIQQVLAAIQRRDKSGSDLLQGQSINTIQPRFDD